MEMNVTIVKEKYVVVRYNGRWFPGKVVGEGKDTLTISCMDYIDYLAQENRFHWPLAIEEGHSRL